MSISTSSIAESASTSRAATHADATSLLTQLSSAPYARPVAQASPSPAVDAILIDAIRASVGPYIPASVRTSAPVAATASLTREPAVHIPVEIASEQTHETVNLESSNELPSIDAFVDHDAWSLHEAGSVLSDLSRQMPSHQARDQHLSSSTDPSLDAWSDDDMMDIMPVSIAESSPADAQISRAAGVSTPDATPASASHWASQAREREAQTPNIDRQNGAVQTEAAAQLLESLARRVRDGELVLPGFSTEMGDAAALASALAALLGVRR